MKTVWTKGNRHDMNYHVAFVTELDIGNEPACITLIAGNIYRLFVDGQLIGYGPARAAHGYTRQDHYVLKQYTNTHIHLTVEVYAANANNFYYADQLPFFGAEVRCAGHIAASTENQSFQAYRMTDRVQAVQRYSYQRLFVEAYVMEKDRTAFYKGDYRAFPQLELEEVAPLKILSRNVPYPVLEQVKCERLVETGRVEINSEKPKWMDHSITEIGRNLAGFSREDWQAALSDKASSFVFYKMEDVLPSLTEMTYQVYDMKRNLSGFIQMDIEVKKQAEIYVLWKETAVAPSEREALNVSLEGGSTCNVIQYRLKAGRYSLLSFEPVSGRFFKVVTLAGEVDVKAFGMTLYEHSDAYLRKEILPDTQLQLIYEACRNTFAQNAVDIFTDCPSRERAGWLCDSFFTGRAEAFFTGNNVIEYNFLENYALSPQLEDLPDGMIPCCYPGDHNGGTYIPTWAMWYVLELDAYYRRTKDDRMVSLSKDKVYGLIRFFERYLNEDGLLENLESWVFIDGGKANDTGYVSGVNYPANMLYARMLLSADNLYRDEKLIKQYKALLPVIRNQSFNGTFFEDNRIRKNGVLSATGNCSEVCQYYAFLFGVADKKNHAALMNKLVTEFVPQRDSARCYPGIDKPYMFIGCFLRLWFLFQNEFYRQLIDECRFLFLPMAETTATLWEHDDTCSLNHGFASVAAYYMVHSLNRINFDKTEIYC